MLLNSAESLKERQWCLHLGTCKSRIQPYEYTMFDSILNILTFLYSTSYISNLVTWIHVSLIVEIQMGFFFCLFTNRVKYTCMLLCCFLYCLYCYTVWSITIMLGLEIKVEWSCTFIIGPLFIKWPREH